MNRQNGVKMLDQFEDQRSRNIITILIAGGGLLGFLGLTLPYESIHYPSSTIPLVFDGFSLSYIESIPQAIGNLIAVTTAVSLYSYSKNISTDEEKAQNQLEKHIFFAVSSSICTLLGLIFTIYNFIDGVLTSSSEGSGETLYFGIGFYFSVMGLMVVISGIYYLVKLRKKLFLPEKKNC